MRLLNKILLGLLLLTLFLGAGYWWRYKKNFVYTQVILSDANLLIDIDLRSIENSLLWDFIAHPFDGLDIGWSFGKEDGEEDIDTPSKGLSIPRHLIIFANSKQPSIWYSAPVSIDGSKFSEYVDTLLTRKELIQMDDNLVFDFDKNIFFHWSKNELAIAYANEIQAKTVQLNLQNLLLNKDVNPLPKEFVQAAESNNHHINFWHQAMELTRNKPVLLYADFLEGVFNIEGDIPFQYVFPINNNTSVKKGFVVNFWANLNWQENGLAGFIQNKFSAKDFSKWTSMSLDTVLQYWDGEMSLQIPSVESVVDSIITYEYDDDFNKIEKVTTQKSMKPKTTLQFSVTQDSALYHYAISVGVIKTVKEEIRYVGFPFLKLYATPENQHLILSTTPAFVQADPTTTNDFLQFETNISAFPTLLDYWPFHLSDVQKAQIQEVSIRCHQLPNTDSIHLTGKIISTSKKRFMPF